MNATEALNYDDLAAAYTQHRRTHPGVVADLLETAAPGAHSRVLEIGCGTANYLTAIQLATGGEAWGVDPSAEMLAHARAQAAPLHLEQGRAEALPLPVGGFDLVFSVDVIHHIGDRPAHFREVARVLKPGGLLCTVTDSELDIEARRPLSSHFPETIPIERARYPTVATLWDELRAARFNAIDVHSACVEYDLTDIRPYRDRAFSSLHLISDDAWRHGLARLEHDLAFSPVRGRSLYTLIWATSPWTN
ncbi:MAG TPA: class I SAM-dependent methyltransferase [Thermomicrobiales bacterium]|nr:class I SAM-dependent methyltransferase [Thermomicrobiales bacterium]